jgi:curved DNA-binding protein CbpA
MNIRGKVTNYYDTLEISNNASQVEIRKSFRTLVLKYHPDRNNNSEEAKQKFMQIVEAYQVLSDRRAKKDYDDRIHCGYLDPIPIREPNSSEQFCGIYDYAEIKRRYVQGSTVKSNSVESTDLGTLKAKMVVFDTLAAVIRSIIIAPI